jgi:uncharacterized protein (TIGR04255 family)
MTLPKKITPERIREATVQLFFNATVPFEPLIGYFYAFLTEAGFTYTNRPLRPKHFLPQGTQSLPPTFEVLLASQHFFFNEKIKVQLQSEGSLVFGCMTSYPGWSEYFEEIKRTVGILLEKKVVSNFHRVGIRYISEFPGVDILEKTNFIAGLNGLNNGFSSGTFRVEWQQDELTFVVNLASKLPIVPLVVELEEKPNYTSLIDIDVIWQGFEESDNKRLFEMIEHVHQKEKEQFFGLLKPDFLKTLNPEY